MRPKVSIVVPIYNVEPYLARCMDSLLRQTLQQIEIILVDDQSPDDCPALCDRYAAEDARVKVVHKKNGGLGFARNSGLEIATGEYAAFVDSDDYVDRTMFERLYNAAAQGDYDAVFSGLRRETEPGRYLNRSEFDRPTRFEGDEVRSVMLDFIASAPGIAAERRYEMSVWHSIYKLRIIRDNDLRFVSEREVGSEDLPFQVDFMKRSRRLLFLPDILYTYCLNGGSLTQTFSFLKYERYKYLYRLLCEKTAGIDGAQNRCDRFIVGYCRSLLKAAIHARLPRKEVIGYIEAIGNDPFWEPIYRRFKPQYLTGYAKLAYRLQQKRMSTALYGLHALSLMISDRKARAAAKGPHGPAL